MLIQGLSNVFLILIAIIIIAITIVFYKKDKKEKTIKRKIFYSIPFAIALIIIIVGIVLNNSKLNYVEEQVYDKAIDLINNNDFFNPTEARLLDIVVKYEYNKEDREYYQTVEKFYLKVSGTNKIGGTINKCYEIYYRSSTSSWNNWDTNCSDMNKSSNGYEKLSKESIKKINTSLKKHWKKLGL